MGEPGPILERAESCEQFIAEAGGVPLTDASGKSHAVTFRFATNRRARVAILRRRQPAQQRLGREDLHRRPRAQEAPPPRRPHPRPRLARRVIWACRRDGTTPSPTKPTARATGRRDCPGGVDSGNSLLLPLLGTDPGFADGGVPDARGAHPHAEPVHLQVTATGETQAQVVVSDVAGDVRFDGSDRPADERDAVEVDLGPGPSEDGDRGEERAVALLPTPVVCTHPGALEALFGQALLLGVALGLPGGPGGEGVVGTAGGRLLPAKGGRHLLRRHPEPQRAGPLQRHALPARPVALGHQRPRPRRRRAAAGVVAPAGDGLVAVRVVGQAGSGDEEIGEHGVSSLREPSGVQPPLLGHADGDAPGRHIRLPFRVQHHLRPALEREAADVRTGLGRHPGNQHHVLQHHQRPPVRVDPHGHQLLLRPVDRAHSEPGVPAPRQEAATTVDASRRVLAQHLLDLLRGHAEPQRAHTHQRVQHPALAVFYPCVHPNPPRSIPSPARRPERASP
ncbi:hypothetical protein [Kitasatospora indigofera]|uniref:hypothetical protein n=1 Tax=Kitasatospora indigofera TaxID=67307 RepID=UPI0033A164D8